MDAIHRGSVRSLRLDLNEERPMPPGVRICIRVALAFAIGVGLDLILGGDTYAYGERFQHQYLIGINVAWLNLLLAFLCSFALSFKWRPLRGENPIPGPWLVDFEFERLPDPVGDSDRGFHCAHDHADPGYDDRSDNTQPLAVRVHHCVDHGGASGLGRIDARTRDVLGGQSRPRAVRYRRTP